MNYFSDWIKIKESVENLVEGPGIVALQGAFKDMASRGVPNEYNDYGFSKPDWNYYLAISSRGYLDGGSIPIHIAGQMLKVLSKYKNTQLPNFEEINNIVQKDFKKIASHSKEHENKIIVFDRQPKDYGKIKVYIPNGLDHSTTIAINKILDSILEQEGEKRKPDNYGRMAFPRFKKFSIEKSAPNTYRIHPGVLSKILDLFHSKGLTVVYESGGSGIVAAEKPEEVKVQTSKQDLIKFLDHDENKMIVRINYKIVNSSQKEFLRESVQYTFPEYEWDSRSFSYTIKGNYKQYITFGRLLKKFGYNVDELRNIVRDKLSKSLLQKTEWEGQLDNDDKFLNQIENKLPELKLDLYDEQKRGIAFLYGRDHAILGDETGLGKTVQLIAAAEMRMQKRSQPTLIITLKSTQQQWINEIMNVMGESEKQKISTDASSPKKWTVLYYDNFSSGNNVEKNVNSIINAKFGIVIFDELHKIKHKKSKRSQNISRAIENIQTRWGASATVSSNKPMDVRNQLSMIGHHLGKVSEPKFKKDFAGMQKTGWGGSLKETDDEDDQIRAAERLNRWLNLSGVYVRRSKSDVRDMPNISVQDSAVAVDQSKFQKIYSSKVLTYKQPNLPISRLIAARETIAHMKTDQTANKVANIVQRGIGKPPAASKVVVFTNFIESGKQLVEKIQNLIKKFDPNFYVLTYLSDTNKKERSSVKSTFTNDLNAKVLIMSMRMGGTGIDFPNAAQNMVINDFDWTPEAAEQSEGRIYRINTNHSVNIDYVLADGIDKSLYELVQRKRKLASIIQQYRKDYHSAEYNAEALEKIIDAQKKMKEIDKQMVNIVNAELPGAGGAMSESFKDYIEGIQQIKEIFCYGFSLDE